MKLTTVAEMFPERANTTPLVGLTEELTRLGLHSGRLLRGPRSRFFAQAMGRVIPTRIRFPGKSVRIVPLMWPSPSRVMPYSILDRVVPYCFDVWPSDYLAWERLLVDLRPPIVFVTSSDSAAAIRERTGLDVRWAPEAVDRREFTPDLPSAARDIDVLQFGRAHPGFPALRDHLTSLGFTVVGQPGKQGFLSRTDLIDALQRSKTVLCFPKTDTHPELAGGLETMTLRYLETLAAGALPIGRSPKEMTSLFRADPVFEIDPANRHSLDELVRLLRDHERLDAARALNLSRLAEVATWEVRALQVVRQVKEATKSLL